MKVSILFALIFGATMFANAQKSNDSHTWKLSGVTAAFGDALGRSITNPNRGFIVDNAENLTIDNDAYTNAVYRTQDESLSPQFSARVEFEKNSDNKKLSSLMNFGMRYTLNKEVGQISYTFVELFEGYRLFDVSSFGVYDDEIGINASIEQKISYRLMTLAIGIGGEIGTSMRSKVIERKHKYAVFERDFEGEAPQYDPGYAVFHEGKNRVYGRVMIPLTANFKIYDRISLEPRFQLGIGALKTVGGKAEFFEQSRTFDVGIKYSFT